MRYVECAVWAVLAMGALVFGFILMDPTTTVRGVAPNDQLIIGFLLALSSAPMFMISFHLLENEP